MSGMEETIDRMIHGEDQAVEIPDSEEAAFIPSSSWKGAKEGYYFGTSEEYGTGYHVDQYSRRKRRLEDTVQTAPRKRFNREELLKEAEAMAAEQNPKILSVSKSGIGHAASSLSKAMALNQMQRLEHPENPEKFLNSELNLFEEISSWKSLAAQLELYPFFVEETDVLRSFLELLALHDNNDVGCAVLQVLNELLDTSLIASEKDQKSLSGFATSITHQLDYLPTLIDHFLIAKLDIAQTDDIQGIDDIFTLLETLLDLDVKDLIPNPDNRNTLIRKLSDTRLFSYLFHHLGSDTPFSPLKLRISELAATAIQHPQAKNAIPHLIKLAPFQPLKDHIDGVESLLQAIAPYRKKNPNTEEETEMLENSFDVLSAVMLLPSSPQPYLAHFIELQGFQLMIRCVRQKLHSGLGALRVLEYCFAAPVGAERIRSACETFVDLEGLKVVFPLFINRSVPKPALCSDAGRSNSEVHKNGKRVQRAKRKWIEDVETHTIHIIYALTRFCPTDSKIDAMDRLLVKFLENDCEKCDRLIELCLKYDRRMRLAEARYYRSDEAEVAEGEGADAVDLAALHAKLRGGGDLFHRLGAVAAFAALGSKRCHEHILRQLHVQNSGIGLIKAALEEFANELDEGDQKSQIQRYISQL